MVTLPATRHGVHPLHRLQPEEQPELDAKMIKALIGTPFKKRFAKGIFKGEIKSYRKKRKVFFAKYTDGDDEELTHAQAMDAQTYGEVYWS